jgi:O-methyltransferase
MVRRNFLLRKVLRTVAKWWEAMSLLPCRPAETYLLSRVIHDWDDLRATEILRSCRRAMAPDARLLILDRVVPEQIQPGPLTQSHAMLDLTMMLWTAGGRERTAQEFEAMMKRAGLRLVRIISMSIPDSLLELTPA